MRKVTIWQLYRRVMRVHLEIKSPSLNKKKKDLLYKRRDNLEKLMFETGQFVRLITKDRSPKYALAI